VIPKLREGVHAYLSNRDGTVHRVVVVDTLYIVMACEEAGVPFGSSKKYVSKVLPTTDPVTCVMCLGAIEEEPSDG